MTRLAAVLALALMPAAPAIAYVADNGLPVRAGPNGTILVGAKGATAGRDFFCAAGDYARRVVGARPTAELVLLDRPARSQVFNGARTGQFALGVRGQGRGTGITVSTRPGESMSVGHANNLCAMDRTLRQQR